MRCARFLFIFAFALGVVPSKVGAVTYGDPVETPQNEFPEVVPIWVGGESLCTGVLIQQQVVLTAAHCIYGNSGPFQVSVNGKDLDSGSLIDVDAIWYHPRYDATFNQNDIGLLHLKSSAGVQRLATLPSGKLNLIKKKFLIVGWGGDQNKSITGKLHRLTLDEQTLAAKKGFEGVFNPKTMIGAGRYFADEVLYGGGCTGDSGGPLYQGARGASKTVVGLTSFGAKGCKAFQPTIFTRVDFYLAEINKGIQLLNTRSTSTPIPTGKATPTGVGPTSTTTTLPKKVGTSCWLPGEKLHDFRNKGSFQFTCNGSPAFGVGFVVITKVCIKINDQIPSDFIQTAGRELVVRYQGANYVSDPQGCYKIDVTGIPSQLYIVCKVTSPEAHKIDISVYDFRGDMRNFTIGFKSSRTDW
jgi:hypothetical protein